MHRRRFLATAAALPAVALAGCLGDDEDGRHYEFDASPARIPDSALDDAGYAGDEPESFTVDTETQVAGADVSVSATTWTAGYANDERGAALFVASTPDASVAGYSVNPLVRGSDAEFLRRLLDRAGDQTDAEVNGDDFEERGETTINVLGEAVDATTFETEVDADADFLPEDAQAPDMDGESVSTLVHFASIPHDDDVVVLAGIHAEAVDEGDTLLSLMETVEH